MNIFFKSNNRIKSIAQSGQILPSKTVTDDFPCDAVTVVLTETTRQNPNFKFYFSGKSVKYVYNGKDYVSPAYRCIVYLNHLNNQYRASFFGGGIPLDELPDVMKLINSIKDSVINGTRN